MIEVWRPGGHCRAAAASSAPYRVVRSKPAAIRAGARPPRRGVGSGKPSPAPAETGGEPAQRTRRPGRDQPRTPSPAKPPPAPAAFRARYPAPRPAGPRSAAARRQAPPPRRRPRARRARAVLRQAVQRPVGGRNKEPDPNSPFAKLAALKAAARAEGAANPGLMAWTANASINGSGMRGSCARAATPPAFVDARPCPAQRQPRQGRRSCSCGPATCVTLGARPLGAGVRGGGLSRAARRRPRGARDLPRSDKGFREPRPARTSENPPMLSRPHGKEDSRRASPVATARLAANLPLR